MTEVELKKLNRAELLAMLVSMSKHTDALEKELAEAKKALESRRIEISEAGTLAEAAIKINKVLEAADEAGKQYLENLQRLHGGDTEGFEKSVLEKCQAMEEETKAKCRAMEEEAIAKYAEIEATVKERCQNMIEDAKKESQKYWEELNKKINDREGE